MSVVFISVPSKQIRIMKLFDYKLIKNFTIQYIIFPMMPVSVDDFHFNCVIGKGTYAKVCLVTRKKDSRPLALKILKKKYIIEKHQAEHIMTQKQILAQIEHPFLVKLYNSFQDDKKLYFVLEYCPGGDLFSLLSFKEKLHQVQAKFIAAEIVLALEALHYNKVVYRDLKPENIIVDKHGYIRLTDFGLSKILEEDDEKAKTICGTPEYLAPEIIKKLGHRMEVDWWCLGCLIYEMTTGLPPFRNENRMKLFEEIISSPVDVKNLSPNLQDLIQKLLTKEPSQRLGHGGAEEIKSHPWFQRVNFKLLENKKLRPPFVPILKSQTDTANFDPQFTNSKIHSFEESPGISDQNIFENFTFDQE